MFRVTGKVLAVAVLVSAMAGCGGGGDAGSAAAPPPSTPGAVAPVISNLVLDSKGAYKDVTISTTDLGGSFSVVSAGTTSVTVVNATILNSAGQNVGQLTVPVQAGSGSTVQFNVTLILAQLQLGTYTFNLTVTNGSGATSNTLTGTYSYLTNPWTSVGMPTTNLGIRFPRHFAATAEVGGRLYVIGGQFSPFAGPAMQFADVFDPATRTWTSLGNAPRSRAGGRAVNVNGKILVVGGYDSSTRMPIGEVDVLDPATNTWSSAAPLPTPRYLSAVAVLNDKVYVMGGTQTPDAFNDTTVAQPMDTVEIFDMATGTWNAGPAMPRRLIGAAGAAVNGGIYVSGGFTASGPASSVSDAISAYDVSAGTWLSDAGRGLRSRAHHALVVAGGKLYAIGGLAPINSTGAIGGTTTVESAPLPASGLSGLNSVPSAPLNEIVRAGGVAEIGGKVYVFGGSTVFILAPELDTL